VVTDQQRRRPRPWAIALGLIAIAAIPVLAVAAMAGSDDGSSATCETASADEQALLTRSVLDVLPAGSVREVAKDSQYDESCTFGGTELSARWDQATGKAMIAVLEAAGWKRAAGAAPDWYADDERPTGAGASTNDNDSPNIVLMRTVEGRTLDLAVDQEGLYAIVARGSAS
jgi:hypothetical protein